MELLDIYDENRRLTGRTTVRGQKRGKNEYALGVVVWIVNGRGELLITLRSPEKDSWPGYWENTGGAVLAGESSVKGCVRELLEETGIRADASELSFLQTEKDADTFFDAYAIRRDIPLEEVRLQPGETADAQWVTVKRFEEMCADGSVAGPIAEHYWSVKPVLMEYIKRVIDN